MLKKVVFMPLLALSLMFLPSLCHAALSPAGGVPAQAADPASCYNPKVAADDLELPMPCGLKMVLRPVAIPVNGLLGDKKFSMGLSSPGDERGLYEKQVTAYVSGPFLQENLPDSWKSKLPADEKDSYCYYFIGKYEISNAQWAAVMEGSLPETEGNLPKANISWYDIQDFLHKYNTWLLANNANTLPQIDGLPAFFRLPTEEEWEFAARGGNLPPEVQLDNDFVLEEGRSVEDYAVFGSRYQQALPIGSRMANPLGLYDMAGNVAEMVQTGFRFTISDSLAGGGHARRLHGSEGGFLIKGGSFLADREEHVYPGKREEARMFQKQKDGTFLPYSTRTLGARLALSSINVPSMSRANNLQKEEDRLNGSSPQEGSVAQTQKAQSAEAERGAPAQSSDQLVSIDQGGDPLRELEKIYGATASPFVKSNLDQFRDLLKDMNASLARERDANLLSSLRSATYKADSLSNIAFRCYQSDFMLRNLKAKGGVSSGKQSKELKKKLSEQETKLRNSIKEHFKNLEVSTNFYRLSVKEIADYPKKDVDEKIAQLRKEYAGEDRLNTNFRNNLDALAEHVNFARTQGTARLSNSMVWSRIMPTQSVLPLLSALEKEFHRKKEN